MRVVHCLCGAPIESADDAGLFEAIRHHADGAHADVAISDAQIREMVAASQRTAAWDGATRAAGEIEIRRLTPDLLPDFLRFFDRDAFMDNPSWASCYCMFYHSTNDEEWERRGADENRRDKSELIGRGEAHGLIAYAHGEPAAWCHAAPHASLPALDRHEDTRAEDDATAIGSIVCFVVAAPYRRQGIATKLLNAACDLLRDLGMDVAEGYPPREAASDARAYHGPLDMYLAARFKPYKVGEHYAVVRKQL